jgi:acyl carrier protein
LSDNREPLNDPCVIREAMGDLGSYVAPRTATERALAEIWRNALGMDRVGISDAFEDLGGDSVVAAVIFAQIEKILLVDIPTEMLIDASTVELLAREIDTLTNR